MHGTPFPQRVEKWFQGAWDGINRGEVGNKVQNFSYKKNKI